MMAMNVDREVLRSFDDVNSSMEASTQLSTDNNRIFYDQINKKAQEDADYAPTKDKAVALKGKVDAFVQYIDGLKAELLAGESIKEGEEVNYNVLQATEPIVQLFFKKEGGGSADKGNKKSADFTKAIEAIKADFIAAGASKTRIDKMFNMEAKGNKSWIENKFYSQPMIAALTNFSKLQSDARTEEGNTVRQLFQAKLIDKLEFTSTKILVDVPDIIQEGTQEEAFIAVGGFNEEASGSITLGGNTYPLSGGKANIPLRKDKGTHTLAGKITYKYKGQETTEDINETYKVVTETLETAPEGGSISADKMNVVYRGVSNPLTATINGADSPISMKASTGSLSGSNGKYTFRASGGNKVIFTASAKTSTGKVVTEKKEFRIKPVPPPQGQIRGKNALTVAKSSVKRLKVEAAIPDFEFPVSFTVTSFKIKVPGQKTVTVNGNSMGGAGRVLDKVKAGDAVNIFDIKVKATGIDNVRNVSPVVIDVQ